MCHEWRRAIEQRCVIEHQAVFRSDKCWQQGEVGSENVNWGRCGIDVLKGIVAMLINICLHTFGGWTGLLCQLCNKLRHTNSGRTQATQRRSRRRERRRHLPVHMQPSGPRRVALTPSGTRVGGGVARGTGDASQSVNGRFFSFCDAHSGRQGSWVGPWGHRPASISRG